MRQTFRFQTRLGGCAILLLIAAVTASPAKAPTAEGGAGSTQLKAALGDRATTVVRSETPAVSKLSASANFMLPWYSFNGGGDLGGLSASQGLSMSVGQSVTGDGSSATHGLNIGFLAGANFCNCPYQGDFDEDRFVTALDIGSIIDILFAGAPNLKDVNCPTTRADFYCDGFSDVLDLGGYIDYTFAGGPPACDPCTEF